jgi:hypothetical protein
LNEKNPQRILTNYFYPLYFSFLEIKVLNIEIEEETPNFRLDIVNWRFTTEETSLSRNPLGTLFVLNEDF